MPRPTTAHIPRATASFAKRSGYRGAHQKAAVESVHFPLWTYNPDATGKKLTLDSADKSDTVSFAKNAVSKELVTAAKRGSRLQRAKPSVSERRARTARPLAVTSLSLVRSPATRSARLPSDAALRALSSAHLKQLVKKIGQDKAMEMLKGAPL